MNNLNETINSKEFFNAEEGMDILKAIVSNDAKEEEEFFDLDWLFDENYIFEEQEEVIEEPQMIDFSEILEDKNFIKEVKKARKYIAHAEANPIKKTDATVTVGYDEYDFSTKSLYAINLKRRAFKLAYCNAFIFVFEKATSGVTLEEIENMINVIDNHKGRAINQDYENAWLFKEYSKKINKSIYKM